MKIIYYIIILFLLFILFGCTSMPDRKIVGLDNLKVNEHVVEAGQIWTFCSPAMTTMQKLSLSFPLACAWIDFEKWECDYYIAEKTVPKDVAHEKKHCDGFDHGTTLEPAFHKWLESNGMTVEQWQNRGTEK